MDTDERDETRTLINKALDALNQLNMGDYADELPSIDSCVEELVDLLQILDDEE